MVLAVLVTKTRSTIERNLAGRMVTNYMRNRRKSKPSKSTLPFPLFGRDFPVDSKTRATLLTPTNDADEAEDVDQPDNLDEFMAVTKNIRNATTTIQYNQIESTTLYYE